MKKVFISQPMNGLSDSDIEKHRAEIIENLHKWYGEIEIIDSFIKENPPDNVNSGLWYLAKSLELLSQSDIAVFAKGWETARGCLIEFKCAKEYGITCYEVNEVQDMTKDELIRNLKYTMKKHENDTVNTFGTNISLICKDVLNYLEQDPCEMTTEEYRQRMIQAFHNADCDELLAICVRPMEKEFEHLEWLLKNHYKKEPCNDVLDNIRTDITEQSTMHMDGDLYVKTSYCMQIIDKYKAEGSDKE